MPIPQICDPEEYTAISEISSEFVKICDGKDFDVKMQYIKLCMDNAVSECFVRKEVYERLLSAQKLLPQGIKLRILDAWRPLSLQLELYCKYSKMLEDLFCLSTLCEEEKKKVISKYISFPNYDRNLAPAHTTGGAVDVTLVDKNGRELDMGTRFDEFSKKSHTAYFEENCENLSVRENRRILYNAMIGAGFTNLPSEWWHYDYGNKFWAYYKGTPALYSGIFNIEEICCK